MGASGFVAGSVIEIDKHKSTLLRQITAGVWQVEDHKTKRISEYHYNQLTQLYLNGQLHFIGSLDVATIEKRNQLLLATDKEQEMAKIRRLYVKAVESLPNTEAILSAAIEERWSSLRIPNTPPHWTTVFRWKQKFQSSGGDILSLIDNKKAKGNRSHRYPPEVTSCVKAAIDKCYLRQERGTVRDTLDYAKSLVIAENHIRPQEHQLPLPSLRHVTTVIHTIPAFDRYAARYGRSAAIKRFRAVQAHKTTSAPLERAEIDHTPLDLMVLDDNSGLPLGRPYLTVCLDDYSRCILGIYISFEPPSHFTVSRCLKMAFLPKTELLKEFSNIKNTWDAHGIMRSLVVDNGQEFHSASLENVCFSLGIEIHYSARKTPWFKGKIERLQGTLNRAIAHHTPGTTFSNIFEKEDYDPSQQAVVRYGALKEIVYTWVVDVYHQQPHRSLNAPPSVVWSRSINFEDILLPDNPNELDFLLGQSERRVLSHKGIELYGLNYNSPELTALRRRKGDKFEVEIRVDTANLGHIIVISPDNNEIFKVSALQAEYAVGLSAWQHKVCKKFAAKEFESYSPSGWLEAKTRIRELIETELMLKKRRTRTKIARFQNMDADTSSGLKEIPQYHKPPALPSAPLVAVPLLVAPEKDNLSAPPALKPKVRLKPVFRERIPNAIAQEQRDDLEIKGD